MHKEGPPAPGALDAIPSYLEAPVEPGAQWFTYTSQATWGLEGIGEEAEIRP